MPLADDVLDLVPREHGQARLGRHFGLIPIEPGGVGSPVLPGAR